jgi:hypothetical protein
MPNMIAHLTNAKNNGADIHVILEGSQITGNSNATAYLGQIESVIGSSHVTICNNGCMGTDIDHNKFFAFSALTNGDADIVAQSSENLVGDNANRDNNMIVFKNAPELYNNYEGYWHDMYNAEQTGTKNLNYNSTQTVEDGVVVHHFPQSSGDYVDSVLKEVDCSSGGSINVGEVEILNSRSDIATDLANLEQQGCSVAVITSADDMQTPPAANAPANASATTAVSIATQAPSSAGDDISPADAAEIAAAAPTSAGSIAILHDPPPLEVHYYRRKV